LATIAGTTKDKLPAAGKKFYVDYKAKFKNDPEAYAIYGYEAASVALAAISKVCQKDRAAIRDAVFATKNFKGVLGTWTFNADGDISLTDMKGNRVVKGAWTETGVLKFP